MTVWNDSYKTAIVRDRLSRPAKYLKENKLLKGRVLDFGCGHGQDSVLLKCDRYDPHYFPEFPTYKYNTIMCNYVLNVLPHEERLKVFETLKSLAHGNGCVVYFAVRTDLEAETKTQFVVKYDWMPVIADKHGFRIYKWIIPGAIMKGLPRRLK